VIVLRWIADGAAFVAWAACSVFVIVHGRRRWRATAAARAVMYRTISLVLVLSLSCATILFGDDYPLRTPLRAVVYVLMALSAIYLTYVAIRNPDEGNPDD